MDRPLSILLADDNDRVRQQLKVLLQAEPGWRVIAEALNGRDAVVKTAELHPDVVVMDISMPGLNGLEATRQALHEWPNAKVLILTMHESDLLVQESRQAGARGCLLKSRAAQELANAIRTIASELPPLTMPSSCPEFPSAANRGPS